MALGSSAPEILLSVIGTCKDLDGIPPELGPSTIVGSAAFNLLVISGLSIIAVGDKENPEVKKIFDVGVFAVTSIFSLFAYVWLYIVLEAKPSRNVVTFEEGWLTLVYCFILVGVAYGADRLNNYFEEKKKTKKDKEMEIKA